MKHVSKVKGAVVVFMPIGLPGMGKSVFYESAFKPQFSQAYPEALIKNISNDEVYA